MTGTLDAEQLLRMDNSIARILDASLMNSKWIEDKAVNPADIPATMEIADSVKLVGEAIKSLAEGLESYRKTIANMKKDNGKYGIRLNDKWLQSMDKYVARIAETSLTKLELLDRIKDLAIREKVKESVKLDGAALKSLAEGLESYRITTTNIRQDNMQPEPVLR